MKSCQYRFLVQYMVVLVQILVGQIAVHMFINPTSDWLLCPYACLCILKFQFLIMHDTFLFPLSWAYYGLVQSFSELWSIYITAWCYIQCGFFFLTILVADYWLIIREQACYPGSIQTLLIRNKNSLCNFLLHDHFTFWTIFCSCYQCSFLNIGNTHWCKLQRHLFSLESTYTS